MCDFNHSQLIYITHKLNFNGYNHVNNKPNVFSRNYLKEIVN